jgi:DNA-binding MarR family transcriptional regulator
VGPLTPRQLQERLGLTSGAITALIDRLERVGWVARAPPPTDRRSVLVALSRAAHETADARLGAYHRAVRRATARLSPSERAAVAGFLDEVTRAALRAADRLREANEDGR